ncbi:MAG TPA: TIGR01459 family HAD-type hydrolase [Caulobacteraceae bacterium]|jgi:HAD superfamily hydrolase (TIGR01459 family)|nr:TIGR01459 family HAD-type hydrolase [Caulobacteraceae bacterium]
MLRILDRLADLAGRYDVLLCDIWGVVHNGRDAFPDACAALATWREAVGPVALISNAARPSAEVARHLDELGVPREAYSVLITSGDVSHPLIAERAPGPAYRIGPSDHPLFEGDGVVYAALEDARFIVCSSPVDDEVETPDDYREVLTRAAALRLPMICGNPDKVVQRGDHLVYCGGALAQLYETLGGAVIMAGKPHTPIYRSALAQAAELANCAIDPSRVLAIGDGIATDIAGANAQSLDVLFVAGGIHTAETRDARGGLDPAAAQSLLDAAAAHAAYAMDALA